MSGSFPSSLADLSKGKQVEGDCGSDMSVPPAWLDMDRYSRTHEWMKKHGMTVALFWHCSLVIGMSLNSLLEALVFTGESSTPATALKRYLDTAARLMEWHVGNVWDESEVAYKSIARVRAMHKGIRGQMEKTVTPPEGFCGFLTQYDMATVQTGFMGGLCIHPKKFGLHTSDEELEDYIYFWRCCGHQLGIEETYNLCGGGKKVATGIVQEIIDQVVLPDAHAPPKEYPQMAQAYVDGINNSLHFKALTVASTNACTYWALEVPGPKLSMADTLRFYCIYRVLFLLIGYCPGFERIGSWLVLHAFAAMPFPPGGSAGMKGTCPFTGVTYDAAGCPAAADAEAPPRCPHAAAAAPPRRVRLARRALVLHAAGAVLAFWVAALAVTCAAARAATLLLPGGGPWGH